MTAVRRLPTEPHHRMIELVRKSMPTRDYRNFPEPVAATMRQSAQDRAVVYAAVDDVVDETARLIHELDSSDGVVVEIPDEDSARSIRRHLHLVNEVLDDVGAP